MNDNQQAITLRIDGVAKPDEQVGAWHADVYTIDGRSRSAEDRPELKGLNPGEAVLELELANGRRILVAVEDAHEYLSAGADRGGADEGVIEVGTTLNFSGTHPPAGISRDGFGAWVLRGFKVWRSGVSAITAVAAAGTFQDALLDDRLGLYRCATDTFKLSDVEQMDASDQPTLLFIHGTASSTEGSFGELWADEGRRQQLETAYGTRIYAYEHRSLTDSPIKNALELVKQLPPGARLHLVSHSRGGMIGELLARANRVDEAPFSESEIDRLQNSKREGYKDEADRLRQLGQELHRRKIQVERFVRVACPARGTTLASGKLDRWATVMLNLAGKGLDSAGNVIPGLALVAKGYTLLQNFLLAVVRQRTNAEILPGLEAMMPDSPLVEVLNAPDAVVDSPLHVIAGDYDGDGLLRWLGDKLSEVFYDGETDLVVNTPSMSGGAKRAQGVHQLLVSGGEVTHFTYFEREETAGPLLAALSGQGQPPGFVRLDGPSQTFIARGGRKPLRKKNAPIVFLLPGIMGSHIQHISNRIWFEPFSMWTGGMSYLKYGEHEAEISADGWMDRSYQDLAEFLSETYEVRPFAYDWRRSIADAAELFGKQLDEAMEDARQRGKPLRIVAHSMGGLVARLALKDRWESFKAIPGSRLLQLGTPNRGSHAIANVLMARDDFVQTIERWFDWKHDMRDFLEIVRDFPGVLELLPWPGASGLADDGIDYFDAAQWSRWFDEDQDRKKKDCWLPPQADPLKGARATIERLLDAPLDPECTLYVAGSAPTPVSVRIVDDRVEIGWTDRGDGRVAWDTGIPADVQVWFTEAAHGDLASHEDAFDGYLELLDTGDTRRNALSRTPLGGSRGKDTLVFRPRKLEGHALYPSVDEVRAAAMGGARPTKIKRPVEVEPATIEIVNGSLAISVAPLLIGAYINDSMRGSARVLDGFLGGQLDRIYKLGRYPGRVGDTCVVRHAEPGGKPGGAIVVGLGTLGELTPVALKNTLRNGLLEYTRDQEQCPSKPGLDLTQMQVSTLLVGSGFTGLSIKGCVRSLVQATCEANRDLHRVGSQTRVARVTLYEEARERAMLAADALRELLQEARFRHVVHFDGKVRPGSGGFRGRCDGGSSESGGYRVHIVQDRGGLRFTIMTDRARNQVIVEADQRQAVEGLIASMTQTTRDNPGLSRAVFELMVPNEMKEPLSQVRTLMISLDEKAAAFPWELMRDADVNADEGPLVTRVAVVRQLASIRGSIRVPTVQDKRVFIVGDTQSDFAPLESAKQEAELVSSLFRDRQYHAPALIEAPAIRIFEALFDGRYRFVHLAGHGVVDHIDPDDEQQIAYTGMVLGNGIYLTPAQIAKMVHVPEFVFINCCHLGAMEADAKPRWSTLAANLATQFIQMGCRAVIAAGWAVDDAAALTFAQTFYDSMFQGRSFGDAVTQARYTTYRAHPQTNTWGAYQAYGDELYRFPGVGNDEREARPYAHVDALMADLEKEAARLQIVTSAAERQRYQRAIEAIEDAARAPEFQVARVRERLAQAWADLGNLDAAIAHYRAALLMENATFSVKAVEQLANLEIRHGAAMMAQQDDDAGRGKPSGRGEQQRKRGLALMDQGIERIDLLLQIGSTAERQALKASYFKRRAVADQTRDYYNDIKDHLGQMTAHYWEATDCAMQRSGSADYYPLFNALDGEFLMAARGDRKDFDDQAGKLADWLQSGVADAQHRFGLSRGFFHALAAVEAERLDALWACYDGRTERAITEPAVVVRLISEYRGVLHRLGSAHEQSSATAQLRFLITMLPSTSTANRIKEALRQLIDGIERDLFD